MEISSTLQTVNQEELPGGMKIGEKLVTLSLFNAFVICAVISFIAYAEFQAESQISQTGWFLIIAAILAAAVLGHLLPDINKSIIKPIRNIAATTADLANEENPGNLPHTNRPNEIGHIARTLMKLREKSQQNAAMAEEATAACHSLNSEAAELTDLLNGFSVNRTNVIKPTTAPAVELVNSPAKQLVSRVSNASEGNAAVKEDEWQEF